jgi:catechol 2,3-dioxygenase-like lactoylglutathione lyase family enzyme
MGFKSVILVVEDVIRSRKLYEEILGCKVEMDFDIYNVGFEGGLALYKKSFFSEMIDSEDFLSRAHNLAIYFEFDDIYIIRDMIIKSQFEFVHDIKEQSWGQKLFRFYDYDKHIIEIAENMNSVLENMYNNGMSVTMIAEKTGYKVEEVTKILKELLVID